MAKTFPYIEVSGSHADVGHAIGETMRAVIQKKITERKATLENYNSYLEKIPPYYQAAKEAFPQLVEELEAIAKAAEVDPRDYFLFNCSEVYDVTEEWSRQDQANDDRCTIAVSFNGGPVVGHNEDWNAPEIDQLYILKAALNKITFLALNYATELPGTSATMNSSGLVQCINGLHQISRVGVPKNFLSRATIETKTLDEAENLIRLTNRAAGFNHVLVQDDEVYNVEIAGPKMAVEKINSQPYVHTNHYLSPELKHLEKLRTNSSEQRYRRAKELVRNNMTRESMVALLSDKTNSKYPICREDATIGSVILLPEKKEVWICYGHPCAGEFVKYTL